MTVTLGQIGSVGGTRFGVASHVRIRRCEFAAGGFVHGAKTPLYVLFERGDARWAQDIAGSVVEEDEIRTRFPEIHTAFWGE